MDKAEPNLPDPAADNESDTATSPASTPNSVSQTNPRGAGTKRKRGPAAVVSSRSVASLTPEQLEKKRKNDREAQRAIRERTKSHIDTLNDKIRAFEQSQPYLELTAAQRQRDQIQEENHELQRKMRQVIGLLQPHVNHTSSSSSNLGEDALLTGQEKQASTSHLSVGRLPPMQMHNGDFIEPAAIPAIRSPVDYVASAESQSNHAHGHGTPNPSQNQSRPWSSSGLTVEKGGRPYIDDPENPFIPGNEKLERGFILNNTNSSFVQVPYTVTPVQKSPAPFTPPIYQMLPRVLHDCALDGVLLRFLGDTQVYHAKGVPLTELEGPPQPSYNILLNPSTSHVPHELSKMLLGIVNTLPDLSRLPEQIAVMHMMYLLMKWQIRPTKENYDAIPVWLQPRPAQIFVTHPHWLDYIPWPLLRDACVQTLPYVSFQDFFVPYTKTYSINWPHSHDLCLEPAPPGYPHNHHRNNSGINSTMMTPHPFPSPQHSTPAPVVVGSPFATPSLPHQQQQQQQQHRQSKSPHLSTHHSPAATPTFVQRQASITSDRSATSHSHQHQHQHQHQQHQHQQHQLQQQQAQHTEPQLILSPLFEAHIMDLENWSLGPMFRDQYPQWAGLWKMKE